MATKNKVEVWAEVGSNWVRKGTQASKDAALECIYQAAAYGADVVKFQLFTADNLWDRNRSPEQNRAAAKCELPLDWLPDMRVVCDHVGIDLWLSVFEPDLVSPALEVADGIKLASGDLAWRVLVEAVAPAKRLCISTGTITTKELTRGLNWLYDANFTGELTLMVCVSAYPAEPGWYNLELWDGKIAEIGCRKGLSDHTVGPTVDDYAWLASLAAVRGYDVVEKHFKLVDTPATSPDQVVSLAPLEFRYYSQRVEKAAGLLRGTTRARVEEFEAEERYWMRRGQDGRRPED